MVTMGARYLVLSRASRANAAIDVMVFAELEPPVLHPLLLQLSS